MIKKALIGAPRRSAPIWGIAMTSLYPSIKAASARSWQDVIPPWPPLLKKVILLSASFLLPVVI